MENPKKSIFSKSWVQSLTGIILIIIIVAGLLVYKSISSYLSIEDATVSSPVISIAPETQEILDEVYVKEGDSVVEGQQLARLGSDILTAKINGTIIYTNNTPGQIFNPSQAVVKMIDPKESKILATVKETENLSEIAVGDPVIFTVDAFGSKEYTGIVEEVSPTSDDTSVVFNISDSRPVKEFTVKIKYDTSLYKEFKNGMSAKVKIYYK